MMAVAITTKLGRTALVAWWPPWWPRKEFGDAIWGNHAGRQIACSDTASWWPSTIMMIMKQENGLDVLDDEGTIMDWQWHNSAHFDDWDGDLDDDWGGDEEGEDIFWGPIKERALCSQTNPRRDILLARSKLSPVTRSDLYCFRPITDSPILPSINILILSQVISIVPSNTARKNLEAKK